MTEKRKRRRLSIRQREALQELLEGALYLLRRGFGHLGELPRISRQTAKILLEEDLALIRSGRGSGGHYPVLKITESGIAALRRELTKEKARALKQPMDSASGGSTGGDGSCE